MPWYRMTVTSCRSGGWGSARVCLQAPVCLCALFLSSFWAAGQDGTTPAPIQIRLEIDRINEGEQLSGKITGAENLQTDLARLVWIDGAGRVVSQRDLRLPKEAPAGAELGFSLRLHGGFGQNHRLVLLQAPRSKNERQEPQDWRIAAQARFLVLTARKSWNDYLLLAKLPDTRFDADAVQRWEALGVGGVCLASTPGKKSGALQYLVEDAIPKPGHPLLPDGEDWDARIQNFLNSRDAGLFTRSTSPFEGGALASLQTRMEKSLFSYRELAPTLYSLGHELSLTRDGDPMDMNGERETLELFRAWLQQRYADLPALNRQWGSAFARWEDVRPPSTDEVKAAHHPRYRQLLELLKSGDAEKKLPRENERPFFRFNLKELPAPGNENFSAWCDHHAYLDFAFSRLASEYGEFARTKSGGGWVGFTGAHPASAWGGYDWSRLSSTLDWFSPEDGGKTRDLIRSFAPDARCLTSAEVNDPRLLRRLWQAWMKGDAGAIVTGSEALWTDLAKVQGEAGALLPELREFASGLTQQRMLGQAHQDAVALLYSPRSQMSHWLLDSALDGSLWPLRKGREAWRRDTGLLAWEAWTSLLGDLGYAPRFVHSEQLRAGLGKLGVKVLILPKVLCLSDEEARAILTFARQGGIVIADSQCGLFDGTGRRRALPHGGGAAGVLDEAFGLTREDLWAHELDGRFLGDPEEARVLLEDPLKPLPQGPSSSELRVNEPGVRPTSAWRHGRTAGGEAAVLSHAEGLGRFVYLNLCLQDYPQLREKTETDFTLAGLDRPSYERRFGAPTGGEALRVLLGGLLAEALGEPPLSVRTTEGLPLRSFLHARWQDGSNVLLAVLPPAFDIVSRSAPEKAPTEEPAASPSAPASAEALMDVRVSYARTLHWYDVRRGSYLGLGAGTRIPVERRRASVLAGLAYRLLELEVKVRRIDPEGLYRISVLLNTARAGADGDAASSRHVLHLEILGPAGERLPHYTRNVVAERAQWTGDVALALNEPAGVYRCVIRDVLTGVRKEVQLLKERAQYSELFPP